MVVDQVQDELDALAVRLGRSLTIDGVDGDLLAYSTQRDDADEARVSSILLRHVAPEVRRWEERHRVADATGPVSIPANPDLGMNARLCVPLRRHDRTLGYLWMLGSGATLSPVETSALRRGAQALADLLDIPPQPRAHAPGREVDRLVRRLVEDGQAEAYDSSSPPCRGWWRARCNWSPRSPRTATAGACARCAPRSSARCPRR
ncbi:hypothetical protein [Pseudonocardia nigra]|uniref:hypothetical protein n=1 Tax=Pseudonocardia nigra TaxID=1921578 RepID=UPI001C5EF194|nr:hypothetical protein [Pseudonocardia nigra]